MKPSIEGLGDFTDLGFGVVGFRGYGFLRGFGGLGFYLLRSLAAFLSWQQPPPSHQPARTCTTWPLMRPSFEISFSRIRALRR